MTKPDTGAGMTGELLGSTEFPHVSQGEAEGTSSRAHWSGSHLVEVWQHE